MPLRLAIFDHGTRKGVQNSHLFERIRLREVVQEALSFVAER